MLEGIEDHPLNQQYPVRMPVYWGFRGESMKGSLDMGLSGREVVIVLLKTASKLERILMKIFRGPKVLKIPLLEKNSILWQLCDGQRNFGEICSEMDNIFNEDIAPVIQRTALALEQLKKRKLIVMVEDATSADWEKNPLYIDPRLDMELFDDMNLDSEL
jgi:hypothetical protein